MRHFAIFAAIMLLGSPRRRVQIFVYPARGQSEWNCPSPRAYTRKMWLMRHWQHLRALLLYGTLFGLVGTATALWHQRDETHASASVESGRHTSIFDRQNDEVRPLVGRMLRH